MINKLRIIHIVSVEKFIDCVINLFDAYDSSIESRYYCISRMDSSSELKYIKQIEKIRLIHPRDVRELLLSDNKYDVVFFHNLRVINCSRNPIERFDDVVVSLPKYVKTMWASWGFDLYDGLFPLVRLDLFTPKTRKRYIASNIRQFVHFFSYYVRYRRSCKLLRRIDYCSTVLPFEYDLLKTRRPYLKAKQVLFHYADPKRNTDIPKYVPQPKREFNILLGNNSAPTGNHIDVLYRLSKLDLGDKKIYAPLSYGDAKNALFIRKKGAKLLPSNFEPLLDFMSYEQYQTIFDSCSSAIYANIRQQAVGNIHLAFRKGLKVFFSEKASFVEYFQEIGYKFYLIEKDLNETELNSPLEPQYAEQNYNVWRKGAEKYQKDFDDMINLIKSDIERERNLQ